MFNHLKPVESFWITRNVWYYYLVCLTWIGRFLADLIEVPDIITTLAGSIRGLTITGFGGGEDTRGWVYGYILTILWVLTRVTGNDTCVVVDCARRRTLEHDFIARSRVIVLRIVVRECHAVNSSPGQYEHIKYAIIITNYCFYEIYLNWARIVWKRITFTRCVIRKIPIYLCNNIK